MLHCKPIHVITPIKAAEAIIFPNYCTHGVRFNLRYRVHWNRAPSMISDKIVDIAAARNPNIGMKIVFTTMLRTVAITNDRVIVRT